MNCPQCQGKTRVVDTTKKKTIVTRLRQCEVCGMAIITDEVPRRPKKIEAHEERMPI